MIAEAIARLGITNPTFVEFGASDGRENCTRNLLENGGSGLWLEGDPDLVETARIENEGKPVDVIEAFLDVDNIVGLIESSRVAAGFDVLVVDVDGNDWWLAEAILRRWNPSLVVTEYNPALGSRRKWVMPYDPSHVWQHDDRYGASLSGYQALMIRFGYVLVACDSRAVNAFWVKSNEAARFTIHPSARKQFVPALPGTRHRRHGAPVVSEAVDLSLVKLSDYEIHGLRGCSRELHSVKVHNSSTVSISSHGSVPVRVGLSESDANEPQRMFIDDVIPPGGVGRAEAVLPIGARFRGMSVVQEGLGWGPRVNLGD